MKSFITAAITISLLVQGLLLTAQTNYQPGSVTLRNGATVTGNIDYREWDYTPRSFRFREADSQKTVAYSVHDVQSFHVNGINGGERYEACFVNISSAATDQPDQLTIGRDTAYISDTVFLKLICTGKWLSLYSYKDKIKRRFYISNEKGEITELLYYRYLAPSRLNIVQENIFRNQILRSVYDKTGIPVSTLMRRLERTDYYKTDLERIVNFINHEGNYTNSSKTNNIHFYGGLSLFSVNARYEGNHKLAKGSPGSNSLYPKLSLGIDIYPNYSTGRLLSRLDCSASFSKHKFETTEHPTTVQTYITTHSFSRFTMHLSPQIIYNIYNKPNYKVNIGTGIGGEFNFFPKNEYKLTTTVFNTFEYREDAALSKFRVFIPFRAGFFLHRKLDIYAQYNYYMTDLSPYINYRINTTTIQAGINFMI